MAKIVIDKDGTKRYFDNNGRLHRIDGPAVIKADGSYIWMQNGLLSTGTNGITNYGADGNVRTGFVSLTRPIRQSPNGNKIWNTGRSRWPKL